jgi:hypothetical protein
MQAVTRVNSEQASKVQSQVPTGLRYREGRCATGKQPTNASVATAGVVETACTQGMVRNVGDSRDTRSCVLKLWHDHRSWGMSDRLIVVRKRRNRCGAKGPDFGVLVKKSEGRGLA